MIFSGNDPFINTTEALLPNVAKYSFFENITIHARSIPDDFSFRATDKQISDLAQEVTDIELHCCGDEAFLKNVDPILDLVDNYISHLVFSLPLSDVLEILQEDMSFSEKQLNKYNIKKFAGNTSEVYATVKAEKEILPLNFQLFSKLFGFRANLLITQTIQYRHQLWEEIFAK